MKASDGAASPNELKSQIIGVARIITSTYRYKRPPWKRAGPNRADLLVIAASEKNAAAKS